VLKAVLAETEVGLPVLEKEKKILAFSIMIGAFNCLLKLNVLTA